MLLEDIFSVRSLILTEDGLHWACVSVERKLGRASFHHTAMNQLRGRILLSPNFQFTDLLDKSTIDDTWVMTIEKYTARELSFEKDQLLASDVCHREWE